MEALSSYLLIRLVVESQGLFEQCLFLTPGMNLKKHWTITSANSASSFSLLILCFGFWLLVKSVCDLSNLSFGLCPFP